MPTNPPVAIVSPLLTNSMALAKGITFEILSIVELFVLVSFCCVFGAVSYAGKGSWRFLWHGQKFQRKKSRGDSAQESGSQYQQN